MFITGPALLSMTSTRFLSEGMLVIHPASLVFLVYSESLWDKQEIFGDAEICGTIKF